MDILFQVEQNISGLPGIDLYNFFLFLEKKNKKTKKHFYTGLTQIFFP